MSLATSSADVSLPAETPSEPEPSAYPDFESALVEGLGDAVTASSEDGGWTDLPDLPPPSVSGNPDPTSEVSIAKLQSFPADDPPDTASGSPSDPMTPDVPEEDDLPNADLPQAAELQTPDPVGRIDGDLENALLTGLADEPEAPPERSDESAISDDSAPPGLASDTAFEPFEPDPDPLFDFEALIEGLPDGASTSVDDGDAPEPSGTVSSAPETPSDAVEPGVAAFPDVPEFPSELLDSLSDGPATSSGDPEPPGLPTAPEPGDASLESAPARSPDLQDDLPDTEIDTAAGDGLHDDADHKTLMMRYC